MNTIKAIILISILFPTTSYSNTQSMLEQTAEEIRLEALKSPSSFEGHPLPLAASWNVGLYPDTYGPKYQMSLIEKGHHILPWFHLDMPTGNTAIRVGEYYKEMNKASKLNLPITFVSSQWERVLSEESKYLRLPKESNPNTVDSKGIIQQKVSPIAPIKSWYQAGLQWTSTTRMRQLQTMYPTPPLVIFLSNNEHKQLAWKDANQDIRFVNKYGSGRRPEEIKSIFAKEWILKYRELQHGIRDGLKNTTWQTNSKFIAYNAFGTKEIGRWPNWGEYNLDTEEYVSPWPLAWDGVSVPFYTHNWDPSTDYNVWGPMVGAMNWVFMQKEAQALNPNLWFEVSIWDGNQPDRANDKRKFYSSEGHEYTPARYQGMVKYAMWLLRPRVVREYRHPYQTLSNTEAYFLKIVNAVDEVYTNQILKKFWQQGVLVANKEHEHPYTSNFITRYKNQDRWFLLDTDLDAKRPWNLYTIIPTFSIALQINEAPIREWLVYCFAPLDERQGVSIKIPDYKSVTVNCTNSGSYVHVQEKPNTLEVLAK
jgi:hypothetical protein